MASQDQQVSVPGDAGSGKYPDWWRTHTVLSDGATVEIRPIKPSDRAALVAFHGRQSPESIYFRFFRHRPELSDRELDFFTHVDYRSRMAFVAFEGEELVAVARYEHVSPVENRQPDEAGDRSMKAAEVAFFVDDTNHGRGLATLMLEYLAAAARSNGFTSFVASVLAENYRMLGVFRAAGFTTSTRFADGVIEVAIDLNPTRHLVSIIAARQQLAGSRSLGPLLEPDVVAIVGTGRRPGSLGHELLASAVGSKGRPSFAGTVLAVNPNADEVDGVATFPTVAAARASIDRRIDLAVVAVPAEQVPGVVHDCGDAGVHGLLIITSGFDDRGGSGTQAQRELVAAAREYGMRIIGPNAFGLANTGLKSPLNLLSVPVDLLAGSVGFASDSGLLAAAVIDQFRLAGTGVSQVVGLGNQADVELGDLVGYWALHEPTKVVVLYGDQLHDGSADVNSAPDIGSVADTRSAADAARMTSLIKPVIALSPVDDDWARLLTESGVILVDAASELADQAALLACQPVPLGNNVAIVSNSASLARLSVAACRRYGLSPTVPTSAAEGAISDAILVDNLDEVSQIFGPTVAVSRSGSVADYESVIVATGVDQEVDAVLLALLPTEAMPLSEFGRLADRINRSVDKPMVVVGLYDRSGVDIDGLPFYTFPEEAARALARSAAYGDWRRSMSDVVDHADDPRWIDELLGESDRRRMGMADPDTAALARRLGIPLAEFAVAADVTELERQARRIGYPVVLKLAEGSASIGEAGGTAIDIHDGPSLRAAHERMAQRWGSAFDQAVVQKLVPHQALARLEVSVSERFGPSLAIGFGGSAFDGVEPLDRTFLPTSAVRLVELIEAFATKIDADSLGDAAIADLAAVVEVVAGLASTNPELRALTMNPILVDRTGAMPVSLELELARLDADPLDEVRRLS